MQHRFTILMIEYDTKMTDLQQFWEGKLEYYEISNYEKTSK